jgi:nucleotide-binding universal stress UspA family protein
MFRSIVVGTDGSATAVEAVRRAVEMAKSLHAPLELVCAYAPASQQHLDRERRDMPADVSWAAGPRRAAEVTLDEAAGIAQQAGVTTSTHACQGDAANAILDIAEQRGADLIVVGNRGMTGAKRFLLGSVPDKISHHAPCSVLIVHTT